MNRVLNWLEESTFANNSEIISRNLFARRHQEESADTILLRYVYLTLGEMTSFLQQVCNDFGVVLQGKGAELGAGCGAVSNALLKLFPAITSIHAIEIVPEVVRLLQQKVTQAAGNQARLIPVFGSFDEIKLPDASLDFAVEFDAFHHSNNLDVTLKETARVLKPGATLLIIDRVHYDSLSQVQREYLLAIEYPESFKKTHGLPVEARLTRRDNGEHEIRRSEWRQALNASGFEIEHMVLYHRRSRAGLIRGLASWLPFPLRLKLGKGCQFVRAPFGYFVFYLAPFLPVLWRNRYRPLNVTFSSPAAFQGKSVIVARRL
jgi:ubiquinone/menaquinone biosynthesis C-methylase UbiE